MVAIWKRPGRNKWSYKVRLGTGGWSGWRAGFVDKRATESLAEKEQARIDRGEVGLLDPYEQHRRRPLADHLSDYVDALRGRNRTDKHVSVMRARLQAAIDKVNWQRLDDLGLADAEKYLAGLLATGRSARTRDHHAATLRSFGGWLVDTERVARNPFDKLRLVATQGDVARTRMPVTPEMVLALAAAAEQRPVQRYRETHPSVSPQKLDQLARDGRHRGLLYITAALTGLRRAELAALQWRDLQLGDQPTVTPRAETTKNRRSEPLPLDVELAARLKAHRTELVQEHGGVPRATAPVFHVPEALPELLRDDAEFAEIPTRDDLGRVLDFHALRGAWATLMAATGVPLQQARRLIRHTDSRLTAKHYEKVSVEQLRPGVVQAAAAFWKAAEAQPEEAAPQVSPNSAPDRAAVGCSAPLAAVGTGIVQQVQPQQGAHSAPPNTASCRLVPELVGSGEVGRAGGIRTHGLHVPNVAL